MAELSKKFTMSDLRAAHAEGRKVAMLTCYDYTTARLMQRAGVPILLVGDSAANVILGHDTTLPASLGFMIEITAAVRRGAPLAMVVGDMPFGSYQADEGQAVEHVCQMVKLSGCDCVKLEVDEVHLPLVRRLAAAGIAVMAHLGLRPQSVGLLGGYRFQGRTAEQAMRIVELAKMMRDAGAVAILLEAVPNEVSARVAEVTGLPVIGCGGGHACSGSVIVTHDAVGLTDRTPRFVPKLGDLSVQMVKLYSDYVQMVSNGSYPAPEHEYVMPHDEVIKFQSNG